MTAFLRCFGILNTMPAVYLKCTLRHLRKNIEIFRTGRIVGRDDDKEHYGLIESVQLETDAEDGDYLIVSGRFLMCLLERRIIYPTFNFTKKVSYAQIVNNVVYYNACRTGA